VPGRGYREGLRAKQEWRVGGWLDLARFAKPGSGG
jgi:hypothetical protein